MKYIGSRLIVVFISLFYLEIVSAQNNIKPLTKEQIKIFEEDPLQYSKFKKVFIAGYVDGFMESVKEKDPNKRNEFKNYLNGRISDYVSFYEKNFDKLYYLKIDKVIFLINRFVKKDLNSIKKNKKIMPFPLVRKERKIPSKIIKKNKLNKKIEKHLVKNKKEEIKKVSKEESKKILSFMDNDTLMKVMCFSIIILFFYFRSNKKDD